MTMDSNQSEEDNQSVAIADLHSEIIRVALRRLNVLHAHMDTVRYQFLIDEASHTAIKDEYNAIKQRIVQHMPGFSVLYCNEAQSHCLYPEQQEDDA